MDFNTTLIRGTLVKRYKRFLSDHLLDDGTIVTAHVANPGSMLGLNTPGIETWLSTNNNPKRKLKFSWELAKIKELNTGLVGVNTHLANKLAFEAIKSNTIQELTDYSIIKKEVKYGSRNSRIDILLQSETAPDAYVEVKSVTMCRESDAEFPDSVTARGTKHLYELQDIALSKKRAVIFFIVQRSDCYNFRIAHDIDPIYFKAFSDALKNGVEAICYSCKMETNSIYIDKSVRIIN